jgi:MFS family permease
VKVVQQTTAPSFAQTTESPAVPRLAWIQVVLASVLMLATLPGRTQGLGLVTEPLLADLRLDRFTYAQMNLGATLLGALFGFPTGWAIDRIGLRWVTVSTVLLLGITVWQFSAVTAGVTAIFILLLATRALGQSALSVCSITTVARWFPHRAGFAMGVYSVLLSVLFAVAFIIVGHAVETTTWRTAWSRIGLALALVIAPLVVLIQREPMSKEKSGGEAVLSGDQLTLADALRTRAFWLFAGAAAAFNLVFSGLGLFNEAVLAERGFDHKTFYHFLAFSSLMSLGGQFLCGWLTRRWRYQTLTCLALAIYGAGLAGIPFLTTRWQLWCLAVALGVAGGMIIVIFFSVWGDLFGQRHLGRIQGAAQTLTVLSSALGPALFARCAALYHSYTPLLLILAASVVLLAVCAKTMRLPTRRPGSAPLAEAQ